MSDDGTPTYHPILQHLQGEVPPFKPGDHVIFDGQLPDWSRGRVTGVVVARGPCFSVPDVLSIKRDDGFHFNKQDVWFVTPAHAHYLDALEVVDPQKALQELRIRLGEP